MRLLRWFCAAAAVALLAPLCLVDFATARGSVGYAVAIGWRGEASAPSLPGLARDYLAVRPLAARAYLALAAGQEEADSAIPMLRQASAVDPRLGAARYRLASHDLATGQVAAGIDQIRILQNLDGDLASTLTPLVLELARVPAHRVTIASRFANHPDLLRLLEQGNRVGLEPEALLEMVSRTDLNRLPNGVATAQRAIAEALIKRRQYRHAWVTWHALAGRRPSSPVFDGDFRGLEGAAPFGWTLTNDQYAQTVMRAGEGPDGSGALGIEAYGSSALTAARQNLALTEGRHRLHFAASGTSGMPYFWSVKCVSGNALSEVPMQASSQWRSQSVDFTIPANCPMQILALRKDPTPTDGPHRLLVANLRILPQ